METAEEKTPVNKIELQSSRKRGKFPEFIFTSGKYNPITVNLSHFMYGKCSYMLFSMSGKNQTLVVLTVAFRCF